MSGMEDAEMTKITEDKTGYFLVLRKALLVRFCVAGIFHYLFNLSYHVI